MKLIAATALAALLALPASAAPHKRPAVINCDATDVSEGQLSEKYKEVVIAEGRDGAGNVIKFWLNPETKTWTVTVELGNDTCGLAAGKDFSPQSFKEADGDPV